MVFVDKRIKADVYQELLRQHVTLWVQRTYPHGKYVFQWIQDHPVAVGGIRTLADWLPYSLDLMT
jgi:hypothetical protein